MEMVFPVLSSGVPRQFAALTGAPATSFADQEKQYKERLQHVSDFFQDVRKYRQAKQIGGPDFRPDLKMEAMLPVIDGKQSIFVRADRERMIKDAVAFAEKEKVKIIIANPRELGTAGPLLKEHHIPVILGKTFRIAVA